MTITNLPPSLAVEVSLKSASIWREE